MRVARLWTVGGGRVARNTLMVAPELGGSPHTRVLLQWQMGETQLGITEKLDKAVMLSRNATSGPFWTVNIIVLLVIYSTE